MTGYLRFQSDRISSRTGKPQGFFAAAHFLQQGGSLSDSEMTEIAEIEEWFKINVPDPPFYEEGNEIRATTWFKAESSEAIENARRPRKKEKPTRRTSDEKGIRPKQNEVQKESWSLRLSNYVLFWSKSLPNMVIPRVWRCSTVARPYPKSY